MAYRSASRAALGWAQHHSSDPYKRLSGKFSLENKGLKSVGSKERHAICPKSINYE